MNSLEHASVTTSEQHSTTAHPLELSYEKLSQSARRAKQGAFASLDTIRPELAICFSRQLLTETARRALSQNDSYYETATAREIELLLLRWAQIRHIPLAVDLAAR